MSKSSDSEYEGVHVKGNLESNQKSKEKKPWDLKSKILLGIGLALLAVALGIVGSMFYGYMDASSRYNTAREASGVDQSLIDEIFDGISSLADIDMDWDALGQINPNIIGWIYVEDSVIDYPIVQGDDNDYYLHHSFDDTYSSSGCIFLDCDDAEDMSSDNNIIYGHNMLNGSMFASLLNFKDQAYLEGDRRVIIVTQTQAFMLSPVFSYTVSGTDSSIRVFDFETREDFEAYISEMLDRAVSSIDFDISQVDKLFSLVTCSYETNDNRTVLCCVQTDAVTF